MDEGQLQGAGVRQDAVRGGGGGRGEVPAEERGACQGAGERAGVGGRSGVRRRRKGQEGKREF